MICRHRLSLRIAVTAALILLASGCNKLDRANVIAETDNFADLTTVDIYRADTKHINKGAQGDGQFRDTVLLLGSERDWSRDTRAVAETLARNGALVAGIHIDRFIAARQQQNAQCLDIVTLLDVFSQHLQEKYHVGNYRQPLLAGSGDGAGFAYLTLAQSANGIFRGALLAQLQATLPLPLPFCASATAAATQIDHGTTVLTPTAVPAERLSLWQVGDDNATRTFLKTLQTQKTPRLHTENPVDNPTLLQQVQTDIDGNTQSDVADLPLVELRAQNSQQDFFALVISGDGGWANIDRDIGNALNARGIDVVGWNSLKYFWQRRTPESAARDLQRVIAHYQNTWHKPRVLLVGFSFGADVIPFMLNRSAPELAQSLVNIALLSPSTTVDFEFHVSNWLNVGTSHDLATLPEITQLAALPLQCLYGHDDDDSACRQLKPTTNWQVVELPGDHHFDGDYEKVTTLILRNMASGTPRK